MDKYLASIGLYRKMMARDASCLFRAVSEQLYYSQNYHQRIRKQCVNFMRANRCNFEHFVQGSFEKYLERLEDPTETTGQVEIKALSLVYRRCFVIYRYPGKPPTEIAEEDDLPKILLCGSNNSHYDAVYPKNYPMDAAVCQALLYELLYSRVLGVEEEELQLALEGFKGGGRRYRDSHSVCSEIIGYNTPEDCPQREEWESSGHCRSEDKSRSGAEDQKATEGSGKLVLPYKVLKALEPELYCNVEFDVWQDSRKELQKTDYMVFAGRQYFLGDKCQVRFDPKGKYYNAFIQEVGSHATAVTVFIEELAEKHLVSLSNLKPVNPVPAWNITPSRKGNSYNHPEQYTGELDPELRGSRWFFKKLRGVHGPTPPPAGLAYEHYRPHPPPRPHYPIPSKRCYQSFDNYSFRSRRSRRQMHSLNKERLSCVPEPGEEAQEETDESAYSPVPDQAVSSSMVPGATAYSVPRVPSPIPPSGEQPITSSEEDPDERSTAGDQAVPWFVNELGKPVAMAPPPPYSYDPNGSDLPRDCKVLQYYYNLGVQWYQHWHSMVQMQQVYQQPVADAHFHPYSSVIPTADHVVSKTHPDPVRTCPHPQEVSSNGTSLAMETPPMVVPGTVFHPLVQEQCGQPPLHPSYEPYVPVLSTTYHYLTPWTPGAGPHPHTYCPSSSHSPANYITAQTHPTHLPHSQFV